MSNPPQLPENHCQLAPVPSAPPTTVSVVELPGHIESELADINDGGVDGADVENETGELDVLGEQLPNGRDAITTIL